MDASFVGNSKKGTVDWLTPKYIIDALGPFDLDPCVSDIMPWKTAENSYNKAQDGLTSKWEGRVFCNPPYDDIWQWFEVCAEYGDAMGICYASTETQWFIETIWKEATAVLFLYGRMSFYTPEGKKGGSPGKGVCIPAWGEYNARRLSAASMKEIPGRFVGLR